MTDAIAHTFQGHHGLNTARHRAMKSERNKDYHDSLLRSSSLVDQTYEYLFGDLSKLAKDITDANWVTQKVRPSAPQASHSRDRSNRLGRRKIYGHHNNNCYAPYRGRNDFFYPRAILLGAGKKMGPQINSKEWGKLKWCCWVFTWKAFQIKSSFSNLEKFRYKWWYFLFLTSFFFKIQVIACILTE